MNTYTVTITGNTLSLPNTVYYDEVVVKSDTEFTFDLTAIEFSFNNILRLDVDYGDGSDLEKYTFDVGVSHEISPITYEIALYGGYSPAKILKHVYTPINDAYFTQLSASLLLQYGNFDYTKIIIPIKIAQPSYYEALGSIDILDTQVIATTANNIFCILKDGNGNIINMVLS